MDIFDITASALTAQRLRLDTISSNLANVNSTRKPDGSIGAYRRKELVFAPMMDNAAQQFIGRRKNDLAGTLPMRPASSGVSIGPDGRPMLQVGVSKSDPVGVGVQVLGIQDDTRTELRMVYDPNHPDANEEGYVEMPNINPVREMVDMITANRAYEANVTSLQSAKGMMKAALEM